MSTHLTKLNSFTRRSSSAPALQAGLGLALCLLSCTLGCTPQIEESVVIYSDTDREYAEPILAAFARRHAGLDVVRNYDADSPLTSGLIENLDSQRLQLEADVLWSSDILRTLQLEKAGLFSNIVWDIPGDWPRQLRSPHGRGSQARWVGFASRARVLLLHRESLPEPESWPTSVMDLADPQWQGRGGVALPLRGATATHFTILRDRLGAARADDWFRRVRQNAVVLASDKQVAHAVSTGRLAFGLVDTDHALVEIDAGHPVEIVFPDQQPDQSGAVRLPNTVAVLADSVHPVAAAELANYLVSSDTEGRLAMGVSGQFPIRPGHPQSSRAQTTASVRWMEVDFDSAARQAGAAAEKLREIFGDVAAGDK